MRYLGLDYGTKKVGLALSDAGGSMGFPHSIIPNDPQLLTAVLALVRNEGVEAIVIGDSRNFAGDANPVAQEARAFGERLAAEGVPVFYEAEMLTTQEARRAISGAHPQEKRNVERKTAKGAEQQADAAAAALILTSYLSRHHD